MTDAVLEALAETARILDDGVVGSAAGVDTCLLLGAGFPFFLGGITRHLGDTGVSERVGADGLVMRLRPFLRDCLFPLMTRRSAAV